MISLRDTRDQIVNKYLPMKSAQIRAAIARKLGQARELLSEIQIPPDKTENWPSWFVVATLILFGINVAFFFWGPAAAFISAAADPSFVYKWQSLIGVLISASVTLFAATVAWKAVQRQISNQRTIASRNEDDAFSAIKDGAQELYGMLNLVWRAIDATLSPQLSQHLAVNLALIRSFRPVFPNEKNLDSLVEIAGQLGHTKRRKFLLFMNMVRSFYKRYEEFDEQYGPGGSDDADLLRSRKHLAVSLRIYLTHAWKYLESFDPDAVAIFAGRNKAPVDHRPLHEHLETGIAAAERGENWLN
jgi:hypothetical protein